MRKSVGFIERHGLWTDEQRRQAESEGKVRKLEMREKSVRLLALEEAAATRHA